MSNIRDQYRIIAGETNGSGAGWADRSGRGRVRFRGKDVVSFLQGLVSNDMADLERGGGIYATYLTPHGRIVAALRLYHRGEFVLSYGATGTGADLASRFDQLTFAEAVQPGLAALRGRLLGFVVKSAIAVVMVLLLASAIWR